MKIEELQKYIQNLSPELYSFAYVLIPDDLQASQMMIDCVQAFLIQKKSLIEKMSQARVKTAKGLLDEVGLHLFHIVFDLSKKRYQQLRMSFKEVESNGGFFALDMEEKAALYLKDKAGFDLGSIEFITSKSKTEVLSYLYTARLKITEQIPFQFHENSAGGGVA